jgi:gas vesicle protein GvpN
MIHGDEEVSTTNLVGGERGYRITRVIDNFIHSVLKTEEDMSRRWIDNRLTMACRHGFTLIYDEFTRSRPEANNVLLAVLQERMLDIPMASDGEEYLRVHPQFTAIFTSNPEEYVGVYRTQDALQDRMVTLDLDHFDEETEVEITVARSGIERLDAETIVRLVRGLRESGVCAFPPTVRSSIKLARAVQMSSSSVATGDGLFRQLCIDVLVSGCSRGGKESAPVREMLFGLMDQHCLKAPVGAPRQDPGRRFGDGSIERGGRE